jgi:hypothetical protein
MVKEAVIHKVIEKVYNEFNGKCVPVQYVYEYLKKAEIKASYTSVRSALDVMVKEGRAQKIKLHKRYALYCIGGRPHLANVLDHEKVEECVLKLAPSFTLMQLAECVLGRRPTGSPTLIYAVLLYSLMRMVRAKKIYLFAVLGDARDRLKVIVQK